MKKVHLNHLQNVEYHALMTDTLQLVEASQIATLTPLKTTISDLTKKLEIGLIQVRKSEHTTKLNALDSVRDNYFKGLSLRIQSESFSPEATIRDHAYKVQILLDSYRNLTRENFRKETDLIRKLVKDLASADYTSAVTALGISTWVEALARANDDFAALYDTRRDESVPTEEVNIKSVRKELNEQYRALIKTIEALEMLQPSAELTTLVGKLNAVITKWNETVAIRRGASKSGGTAEKKAQ